MSELQELTVKELITKIYNTQHQLQRNTAYAVGDIATSPDLPSWAYLECIQAGTTSSTPPQQFSSNAQTILSDGSVKWRIRDIRCRYEVGDLVPKLTTPKSYEYLMLCDGSTFDASEYPLLAAVFPDGVLPDLSERVLQGADTAKQYREAGLPNITGKVGTVVVPNHGNYVQGAIYALTWGDNNPSASSPNVTGQTLYGYGIDASRSSAVYGKSSTVQPAAYTVKYYVCYGG